MRSFLDNISFTKNVHLKEPKETKPVKVRSKKPGRIFKRLTQLVYFIVALIFIGIIFKYGALHAVSFVKGYEYQSWEEVIDSYKESAKRGHY